MHEKRGFDLGEVLEVLVSFFFDTFPSCADCLYRLCHHPEGPAAQVRLHGLYDASGQRHVFRCKAGCSSSPSSRMSNRTGALRRELRQSAKGRLARIRVP